MPYPDYITTDAVKIYRETGSVKTVIEKINETYGVKVSKRSVQYWVKNVRLSSQKEPVLFAVESSKMTTFDPKKVLELHQVAFGEEESKLKRLQETLLGELNPDNPKVYEQIRKMGIEEKVRTIGRLQKLRTDEFEFILDLMPHVEGEQNLSGMAEALLKGLGGGNEVESVAVCPSTAYSETLRDAAEAAPTLKGAGQGEAGESVGYPTLSENGHLDTNAKRSLDDCEAEK
jgi:hypothetical protein